MQILYHHRTASRDGQAVHIDEIIAALRDLGHQVTIVAPASQDDQDLGASVGWIARVRALLPKALYELLELAYSFHAYRKLAKAVRAHQPDVIYERYNLYMVAGIWIKRRFGLPLLLEINSPLAAERAAHGGLALPGLAKRIEAWTWRGADAVLPVTQVLAQEIQAAGVPSNRIHVIPNGINPANFSVDDATRASTRAAFELQDRLVLGFTGFIRAWHGLDRVVRWMGEQRDADAIKHHLLVVGDGPEREPLQQLARELALEDRITFTGLMPRARIPALVATFDIALQPAVVPYASPLKLFEYLALGRTVIAPRQPNLEEILQDGTNARLFDPSDPNALAHGLSELASDSELRERLGAGARATIEQRGLTWPDNARRIVALFEQHLAKSTRNPR